MIFAFLFFPIIAFGAPPQITLEAYNEMGTVWSLEFTFQNDGGCTLNGDTAGGEGSKVKVLNPEECEGLNQEVDETLRQLSHEKGMQKKPRNLYATDEPNYDFLFKNKKFYVPFEAPRICDTFPNGDIHCKVNDLKPAQILLISMRKYARSLDLGFVK